MGKNKQTDNNKESRRMTRMGKSELQAKFWPENFKGRGHVEELIGRYYEY
jgi:hypothetical protein